MKKQQTKTKRSSDNYIVLLIHGAGHLGMTEFAEEFFQMLQEVGEKFVPSRLGICEPMKTTYSKENAIQLWMESEKNTNQGGGILFKGSSGFFGSVDWDTADSSNSVSLRVELKVPISKKEVERLITFAKELFIWSNGFYGHAYHGSKPIFSSGLDYKTCLPGISWLNMFGKPYVSMFGTDVLESAPCYVEKFAENNYILLTSEEPSRVTSELLEKHELVKNHLGKEAFDRKDPPSQPFYTMEDIQAGRHLISKEGYRSPDLSGYLKNPTNTKSEELFAMVNDDGTISSFKQKL